MSDSIDAQARDFFDDLHELCDFRLKDGAPAQEVVETLLWRAAMVATIGNVPGTRAVAAFTRMIEDARKPRTSGRGAVT